MTHFTSLDEALKLAKPHGNHSDSLPCPACYDIKKQQKIIRSVWESGEQAYREKVLKVIEKSKVYQPYPPEDITGHDLFIQGWNALRARLLKSIE